MELKVGTLQIASLLLAVLLFGCSSAPKQKTEFEKQIDAVPKPTTEADRLVQCKNLSSMYLFEVLDAGATVSASSLFQSREPSRAIAIYQRMIAISCTRAQRQPWLAL
ncbi:hypothetical protein [Pseudomonas sp. UMAB-40]|uniref:hypothetical protein n=1 Tax=Pseudomonas sp. UMAB-40 TaxID=1365407 RepID=UPI001C59C300|nr:hypothetical protein [Pseudomonas sp. UMAB-40]